MKNLSLGWSAIVIFLIFFFPQDAFAELGRPGGRLPPIRGSVNGGDVELTSGGVLSVAAGWPSVYAQYDFPTSGRFGLGIRSDFFFGMPVWGFKYGLGWGVNVPMRIEVLDRGPWNVALLLDAGMFIGFDDHWYGDWYHGHHEKAHLFGPNVGFGIVASVRPVAPLNIFFGMRVPIYILIVSPEGYHSSVSTFGQIQTFFGVEFAVARSVALFTRLALGPTIGTYCHDDDHCDIGVRFTGNFHLGAIFFFGS